MTKKNRAIALLLSLAILFALIPFPAAYAAENTAARDISGADVITDHQGFYTSTYLFDGDKYTMFNAGVNAYLTLEHEEGIGSVYFIFGMEPGLYTVTNNDTGESRSCGEGNFLHDFVDMTALFGAAPRSVTLSFGDEQLYVNEVKVYTPGQVPDTVQKWNVPAENGMDLLLFSTHGDDEQLFFAGILPYYAKEMDYEVLVVYLTDHRNLTKVRVHEMLDGLWAVGVQNYPVLGKCPDFFVKDKGAAYSIFLQNGFGQEELTQFVVDNIRRYKPKVAVGHDPLGEYSHGQHMVYSEVLQNAVQQSMDPTVFPESAEKYGVWDVPKTYLHLYTENQIYMDWDQPLDSFDGMSAFEVSKKIGFPCHASQIVDFDWYLRQGETAAELTKYSPCEYGLYRTTVGADAAKNDFFENVSTHAQDRQKAEEEAARIEAERLAEEERKKAEEEAARQEAERKARQEQERQEAERLAREAAAQKQKLLLIGGIAAGVLVIAIIVAVIIINKKHRGRY